VEGRSRAKKKLATEELFEDMLARTLGYKSAARMLADLTAEEYCRWVQSYSQQPWGEHRDDLRAAANTLWHVAGMTRQDPPELIHPYFPKEETPEELDDRIKELSSAAEAIKAQWPQASPNSPSS
jgi:hypothetical protein